MKIKSILAAVFFSTASYAGEQVNIKVKGMVCSFCAQGIKKKFSGEKAVSKIDVNLDEKWVKLELNDGAKLLDDRIKTLIGDAGYNVASIDRSISTTARTVAVDAPKTVSK